ncbi:MAG: L-serine ammonia-lyase, iron-sulfur-dependent, subunit alpha, partial [Eubacterium sp.]|nr:L-serine ammonia-lyase, iron-sulfur-dependent, subunit alpha [Eubacterium sp.]
MENLIYHSIADIYKISDKDKLSFWQVVLKREAYEQGISEEEVFSKMRRLYLVMKEADKNYDGKLRSESGMSGGDGLKFEQYDNARSLFSPFSNKVCERALKMGENNACMKRIVAAP